MDAGQFSASAPGRLITAGSGDGAYLAFVPNGLPPEIAFEADWVRPLSAADRALGELAGLARAMAAGSAGQGTALPLLIRPFIRREAVLSSRIEGTQADLTDILKQEAKGPIPAPDMKSLPPYDGDVREVLNYVRALEYGLAAARTRPVDLAFVRELHRRLMEGVRVEQSTPGEFRRRQNWIGRPGCTLRDADFVPPPVPEMEAALESFAGYLAREDESYPPLVRLALIHYQFEAIHPFLDGNGRIGRLLLALLFVGWNLLPLPLLYVSAFFERNRPEYYRLLRAVSERGAWTDWLGFFLRGVAEQSRDAVARAGRLQDLRAAWRERLAAGGATATLLRLTDSLFETPVISIPQAQQFLGVTYRGAKLNVDKLVKEGILQAGGESSYGKTFVAEEILRVIG